MSSKNKTETHSVQKREPYAPAKPNIDAGLSGALNWYNSDAGKYYYPDNTFAPMSAGTEEALNAIETRAREGSDLTRSAETALTNTINGQEGPATNFYQTSMGGGNDLSNQGYDKFLTSNSPSNDYFNDIASGSNPYLDKTFDDVSDKISDYVNSNFSKAGRYGSAAHQGKLTEDLGRVANSLYGGAYEANQGRRMAAAGALENNYQNNQNREFNATGAKTNIDAANRNNRFNAANSLSRDDQINRDREFNAAMAAPRFAANDYADYDKLLRTGAAREGYTQRGIDDKVNAYNFENMQPGQRQQMMAQLNNVYANLGGTNTTDGTTTQETSGLGATIGNVMGGIGSVMPFMPQGMFGRGSPSQVAMSQPTNYYNNMFGYN